MLCEACVKVPYHGENDDCIGRALDVIKKHYTFYKNALQQRDLDVQRLKERNEKLNKALLLLKENQHPAKRVKSQTSYDSSKENNIPHEKRDCSDYSPTDDETTTVSNLNMALNSEQLFDSSALSQTKNNISITSSEMVRTRRLKESPKRNKQLDAIRIRRSKSEWHTKERYIPADKSWALKFLQSPKTNALDEREQTMKPTDKKLRLSLKKNNPSKMKQSLIQFNKSKDSSFRECEIEEVIDASPPIVTKNEKAFRSWAHRSVSHKNSSNNGRDELVKEDNTNNTLLDIVFDFSPSKKTERSQNNECRKNMNPKKINFDCISLPNDNSGSLTNRSDSSSVVILTPASQDVIFLDDSCNTEPEMDTIDLFKDIMNENNTNNLEKLKRIENKCIQNQLRTKDIDVFKKPSNVAQNNGNTANVAKIKKEQNLLEKCKVTEGAEKEKPNCSKNIDHLKIARQQNPLLSSDEQDTEDDEDFMPKPFIIKIENECSKELSLKQRFNIDCEYCEKLVSFLGDRLTDAEVQQHLDKCKHHNNPDVMRLNTPNDFWNPFILSFQADDPRNEVLIDNRFKDNNK